MQFRQRANELQVLRLVHQPLLVLLDKVLGCGLLLGTPVLLLEQHRLCLVLQHRAVVGLTGGDLVVAALGQGSASRQVLGQLQHLLVAGVRLGQCRACFLRLGHVAVIYQRLTVSHGVGLVIRVFLHDKIPGEQRRAREPGRRGGIRQKLVAHHAIWVVIQDLLGHLDRLNRILFQRQLALRQKRRRSRLAEHLEEAALLAGTLELVEA